MIIHNLSNNLIEVINSKLTISLYLDDKYTNESFEVKRLKEDLLKISSDINIEFLSKDEVLEQMRKKDEELVSIIQLQNPLPATINISNIDIDQYSDVNFVIEWKSFILSDFKSWSIYDYSNQYNRIIFITQILKTLKLALYIIIWIFLLAIFVIIYSIIWNFIFYYREEISITKLVWWSNIFIYWPFILQWLIYSFISFILSFSIYLLIINNAWIIFWRELINNFILSSNFIQIFLLQLIIFSFIWAFSAYMWTRKYIK